MTAEKDMATTGETTGEVPGDDAYFDTGETSGEIKEDPVQTMISEVLKEEFYHGGIAIEDLKEILFLDGDFVLRVVEHKPENMTSEMIAPSLNIVVSAKCSNGAIKDFPFYFVKSDTSPTGRLTYLVPKNKKETIIAIVAEVKTHEVQLDEVTTLRRPMARKSWQLPKENISYTTKLGEGAFGTVWKGTLKTQLPGKSEVEVYDVAIKVTKMCSENQEKLDEMLKEARMMRNLNDPFVVRFYGMVLDSSAAVIVMELINGNSIDNYLKANPDTSTEQRILFGLDLALGIRYLHSKSVLHRDIAARNCLVQIDGPKMCAKLSDFGMSRMGLKINMSVNDRMPIRWQAPEVLTQRIYTQKCDCWSYGMTITEIMNGEIPFVRCDTKVIRKNIVSDIKFRPKICKARSVPFMVEMLKGCFLEEKKRLNMWEICMGLEHARKKMLKKVNLKDILVLWPTTRDKGSKNAKQSNSLKGVKKKDESSKRSKVVMQRRSSLSGKSTIQGKKGKKTSKKHSG